MSLQITRLSLEVLFDQFVAKLLQLNEVISDFRTAILAGAVPIDTLYKLIDTINKRVPELQTIVGTAGFIAYADAQRPGSNTGPDLTTARNAILALRNATVALIPTSNGFALVHALQADGSRVPRQFPSVTTASLVPLADAALSSLE